MKSIISKIVSIVLFALVSLSLFASFSTSVVTNAGVVDGGYGGGSCGPRKVRVAGRCVCNPEHPKYLKCKDSDNKTCPEGKFRLGRRCVKLKKLDKINDAFWMLYDQGFWPNLRIV